MRTSLIEIERIDRWLFNKHLPEERLLMEAELQLDEQLRLRVSQQKAAQHLVWQYGRKKLKQEIKMVEKRLFDSVQHRSFQNQIKSIFNF